MTKIQNNHTNTYMRGIKKAKKMFFGEDTTIFQM